MTDARRLLTGRALRGFADGLVSVLLAGHLTGLGFSPFEVGAIATGTLLGSAALTLAVGLLGGALPRRRVLLGAALLMLGTGLGFAGLDRFWPLLVVAVVGTLNPSSGDVSVFLPVEQALLADVAAQADRPRLYALYNLAGAVAGAGGALATGLVGPLSEASGAPAAALVRGGFWVYTAVALAVALLYRGLTPAVDGAANPGDEAKVPPLPASARAPPGAAQPPAPAQASRAPAAPLARSRGVVLRLAALFSLDSFGGGLVVQSLLVLWLWRRFGLSREATAAVFFAAGLLAGLSQLVAARLAARIGLVETMVFTHLPSNALLILAGLLPTAPLAVGCLLLRMALSQMDVPARQALVMESVPPEERAAAASVTNVPRSLASAIGPLIAGALLERSSFGWPLLLAGALKGAYDLLLWRGFRHHRARPPSASSAA